MSATRLRYRGPRHWDRTLALELGEVDRGPHDIVFDTRRTIDGGLEALRAGECELAEVPLGAMFATAATGDESLTVLPIFLSRRFPHRFLWVRADSELDPAGDLGSPRVGWAPGSGAAAAWSLHLLKVEGARPEYVPGAMGGSMAAVLDWGCQPDGDTLPEALLSGSIDVLATPYPVPPAEGGEAMCPLYRDLPDAERAWVGTGGVFAVTTAVALRTDTVPTGDLPGLLDLFDAARVAGEERLRYTGAPAIGLPWLQDHLLERDRLFAAGAYPHGFGANESALEAFSDQAAALGITSRRVDPRELFPAEALDWGQETQTIEG